MKLNETTLWMHKIQPLVDWHGRLTDKVWLQPFRGRGFVLMAVIGAILAVIANAGVRQHQISVWQDHPDFYYLGDMPLVSTTDASYFLSVARALKSGESRASVEAKRLYPNRVQLDQGANAAQNDGKNDAQNDDFARWRDAPLLSVAIAALSASADRLDIMLSAHALIPITAALTALAIVFAFGAAGYWLEASVAAIGGGLSASYLVRSSAGRIDTDQLNLGFFYLLIGLVVLAARSKDIRLAALYTAIAALVGQLFIWWYGQSEFLLAAFIALLWLSFVLHFSWRRTILLGLLFWLLSGGVIFQVQVSESYIFNAPSYGALKFPNTHDTITELAILPLGRILLEVTGNIWLGIFCLIGLGLWALRHPVLAVAYGPLAAFGLLNFFIGNRAVFYSAPIIWFGGAWLLITFGRWLALSLQEQFSASLRVPVLAVGGAMALLAGGVAWSSSSTKYVPDPSFPPQILVAFNAFNGRVDPNNAVIASWWDYGYASLFLNGLPTLHDPGAQISPTTHLAARALLDADQEQSAAILKYLVRDGLAGIVRDGRSTDDLYAAIQQRADLPTKDIYLVLTEQMGQWMGSISQLGNWDLDTGRPMPLDDGMHGPVVDYQELSCGGTKSETLIICDGYQFDLETGEINGMPGFGAVAEIHNGVQSKIIQFGNGHPILLQLHKTGNAKRVMLVHHSLYNSSFNQLFHRGQDHTGPFDMVYDNYPHVRVFRLKGGLKGDQKNSLESGSKYEEGQEN